MRQLPHRPGRARGHAPRPPPAERTRKAVAYVGYGDFGAVTAVQELRAQAGRLWVADIEPQMALSRRADFAASTEFKPQLHIQEVGKLVEELLTWNTALAPLRAAPRAVARTTANPCAWLPCPPASPQ
jgi:hypothetical protein